MSNQTCDGDYFHCKFDDCILDYDEVPIDERLDDFILDEKIVKRRERMRQKYKENRDHIRALWDKYYNANKEKFKIYKHNYYIKNRNRIVKQQFVYRKRLREIKAKLKKEKIKPKIVPKFQVAEYQIAPIEIELNRKLKEAKQFIEHLSSFKVGGKMAKYKSRFQSKCIEIIRNNDTLREILESIRGYLRLLKLHLKMLKTMKNQNLKKNIENINICLLSGIRHIKHSADSKI